MILRIFGHGFHYECENLCRVFFPSDVIITEERMKDGTQPNITVIIKIEPDGENKKLTAKVISDGKETVKEKTQSVDGEKCKRTLFLLLLSALRELTSYTAPWGILTGVRPAKLFHTVSRELRSDEKAVKFFTDELSVSEEKALLAKKVAEKENRIISLSKPDSFSLYISIPFCPSRCSYCSFVSSSIKSAGKLIDSYVELLKEEIRRTGEIARDLNLKLETVYFGGGTPTTLCASQLGEIMDEVEKSFDFERLKEYTVEAGRPDTVTREKLEVIKRGFPKRISINPQTLNDDVLKAIGRAHTVQDFYEKFALARLAGFRNINCDIIAGLPLDTPESFKNTVLGLCGLEPESITVHTLSLKRSSNMGSETKSLASIGASVSEMLRSSDEILTPCGYEPYYMYRQSKMAGNLENVGRSKNGYECLYNVFMMDETHTVLACGAGAVTKLKAPNENRIERIFNYKYPFEYISNFDTLIERKKGIKEFYSSI